MSISKRSSCLSQQTPVLQTKTATFHSFSMYKLHLIISLTLGSDQNFSQNGAAYNSEITVLVFIIETLRIMFLHGLLVSVGGCCIQILHVVFFQVKTVFSLFPMQGERLLAAILMLCQGSSSELVFS